MKFDLFEIISRIDVELPESWNRAFLTFDIDWAHDEILDDTIELVKSSGFKATWFATHHTPLLEKIHKNNKWELGIHPNFNALLEGKGESSAQNIIKGMLQMVPHARSIRSHSLVQSSRLAKVLSDFGITHDSNDYVPSYSGIEIKPFVLENGLIKTPYFFSDELWCLKGGGEEEFMDLLFRPGLRIFDFHPIHIFLNSESLARYEATRPFHRSPKELIKYRYDGYGTRNRLIDLLSKCQNNTANS